MAAPPAKRGSVVALCLPRAVIACRAANAAALKQCGGGGVVATAWLSGRWRQGGVALSAAALVALVGPAPIVHALDVAALFDDDAAAGAGEVDGGGGTAGEADGGKGGLKPLVA